MEKWSSSGLESKSSSNPHKPGRSVNFAISLKFDVELSTSMDASPLLAALVDCTHFAAVKHRKQKRKDAAGTPYINHPIGVARILAIEGGVTDLCVLQAALLHDTVEDTDTTFEELETQFGQKVADVVKEVTDDKSLPSHERKRLQIVHASQSTREAKLVKLADKLYNLRDLERSTPVGWTRQRVQEYFVWSRAVVNNLRGTCPALEEKLDEVFARNIRNT